MVHLITILLLQIMNQNLAVILWQFYSSKITFAVLAPRSQSLYPTNSTSCYYYFSFSNKFRMDNHFVIWEVVNTAEPLKRLMGIR